MLLHRKKLYLSLTLATLFLTVSNFLTASNADASDPTGRWKGEWTSQSTGHRGPMRANIRQSQDGTYQARFSGRFAVVIPFTYKVQLHPRYDEFGNVHLSASKPLGPLLGSYSMHAISSGSTLQGSFNAAKDVGAIKMNRIGTTR
jgi:hypothetical protein